MLTAKIRMFSVPPNLKSNCKASALRDLPRKAAAGAFLDNHVDSLVEFCQPFVAVEMNPIQCWQHVVALIKDPANVFLVETKFMRELFPIVWIDHVTAQIPRNFSLHHFVAAQVFLWHATHQHMT